MKQTQGNAEVCMRQIVRDYTYDCTPVLALNITYPQVKVPGCRWAGEQINRCIRSQVQGYCREAEGQLYSSAVRDYCYAKKMDYPFHPYELTVQYTVAYNENCFLSIVRDAYRYTGGAHGVTPRASDTFDLRTGNRVCLDDLFPCLPDWGCTLLGIMLAQAEEAVRENPGIFFDNYRELMLRYFCPDSFYLTDAGIVIYYQQYEIGPYVSGIIEFTVPYEQAGATPPGCECAEQSKESNRKS